MTPRLLALLFLILAAPVAAQAGFDPFNEARIDPRPGARIPLDVPLRDEAGRRTSLRHLAGGRPILLVPVLHNCPNLCGVTLAGIADAIARQPLRSGRDFTLVAFGIDPAERPADAAADLARLQAQRRGAPPLAIHATVGARQAVRAVTDAAGYHYAWDDRLGQYAHAAAMVALTPDGRLSAWIYGLTPEPAELQRRIGDAAQGRTGGWARQMLLLCFHYDPETGRYTLAIQTALKLAAGLTVLALVLLFFRMRRHRP